MTKILLDTNAYSSFMSGNELVFECIVEAETVFVSTIVLGELFAGFHGGKRLHENREELKRFLGKPGIRIIDVSFETSEIFSELKAGLSRRGNMIPLNDIWIAAHTVETGSKLVTFDAHFRNIAGLRVWDEVQ